MTEPRDKIIKLRCTSAEYDAITERAEGHRQLAVWARTALLDPSLLKRQSKTMRADPQLLRQLAGIGNNLNQIARVVNQSGVAALDKVKLIAALAEISAELQKIRSDYP